MYYLEKACDIQIAAQAVGAALVAPPHEVCEHIAPKTICTRMLCSNRWTAMLRLPGRIAPGLTGLRPS
ncbi:hypothetical protein [Streptomyces sp. NPDC005784]|uniref:hypothetical protein n=1 Tax=Streptomyces sp. NPDC005784 TaxID=3364731 RepID=UPI0036986598